ncbi:hypothetical protein G9A89_023886 [Geosiphon pyriformis]|nr:hypothetical protein G9A89_023886 [Geosiphon pyriformis]
MIGKSILKPQLPVPNSESSIKLSTISNHLSADNTATNLSTISISNPNLLTTDNLPVAVTSNILTAATSNLSASTINSNTAPKPSSNDIRRFQTQNYPKLEIGDSYLPTDPQLLPPIHWITLSEFGYQFQPKPKFPTLFKSSKSYQQITLINNISPTTVINDKSLAAIFLFKLEETTTVLLFSRATLEKKPIMAMYTDVKVDEHSIKLILNSELAGSIIIRQLMDQLANRVTKTPIGEIDNLLIEVNGIIIPIKVLVMEANQYQALIGNNWLSKASTIMDWNMVLAICGHFKSNYLSTLLIKLKEKKLKPTWEAYQVLWTDNNHNKLLLILSWDKPVKGKQREKLIWETDDLTWTDNDDNKLTVNWENKGKGKENDTTQANNTYIPDTYALPQQSTYRQSKLICINCSKKLSSMGNNKPCLACEEMYNTSYQYTILINDWVKKRTPIEATWRRAVQQLDSCSHNDNKIWGMAMAKIEGTLPEEIREIKNNPPEPIELDWDPEPVINLLNPEQFHEHYQELALTREKQEQHLEKLNTRLC